MNVIFLDIDGVLNNDMDCRQMGSKFICPKKARMFSLAVRAVDAKIVISSSWRLSKQHKDKLMEVMAENEILDRVIGETEFLQDYINIHRSHEIAKWIKDNPFEDFKYAIVDDDPFASNSDMKDNFFHTDENVGITVDICNKIVNHFRGNKE